MTFARLAWPVALGLSAAAGCDAGSSPGGSTGSGGSTTTSATTSSTATGVGGEGGAGGAGGGASTGVGGSGGMHAMCSGASPSLANDVVPITKAHCGAEGCHAPLNTAAGTYQYMVSRLADQCTELRMMVEPGHPEKSYMVDKITGTNMCSGESMPKDAPLLPDAEIQIIIDWICAGAQQN